MKGNPKNDPWRKQRKAILLVVVLWAGLTFYSLQNFTFSNCDETSPDQPIQLNIVPLNVIQTFSILPSDPLFPSYEVVLAAWQTAPVFSSQRSKPLIVKHAILRNQTKQLQQDIILATHISVNKVDALSTFLHYWSGPTSIAIYITSKKDIQSFFQYLIQSRQQPGLHAVLQQASFHFGMERPPINETHVEEGSFGYPHNILRNVALESIESDYFALFDVDFIPSPQCYPNLMDMFAQHPQVPTLVRSNQTLLVIPAFELFPREGELFATQDMLPQSKQEVAQMVRTTKRLVPFRKSYPVCQSLTNFDKWLQQAGSKRETSNEPFYPLAMKGDLERRQFEPYVVGYRPGIHRYWEDFRGFGFDKYSYFIESQMAGYNFAALNDFYTVHLDHPEISREEKLRRSNLNQLYYDEFLVYLYGRYGYASWPNSTKLPTKWYSKVGKWFKKVSSL